MNFGNFLISSFLSVPASALLIWNNNHLSEEIKKNGMITAELCECHLHNLEMQVYKSFTIIVKHLKKKLI